MNKTILSTLVFLCFFFTGFSQSKTKITALDYNDFLSNITDSLYSKGAAWGTKFAMIKGGDHDFSQLKPLRKDIAAFIILKKEEVKKQPPVGKGGEDLKRSMLSFLEYELEMIEAGFMPIENLTPSSPDKEVEAILNKLMSESEREGDYLKMVSAAQAVFARENGFEIEKGENE